MTLRSKALKHCNVVKGESYLDREGMTLIVDLQTFKEVEERHHTNKVGTCIQNSVTE